MEFCRFLRSVKFGAMFPCGYSGVRVAAFFDILSHFLALLT